MKYFVEIEDGTIRVEVRETGLSDISEFDAFTLPFELEEFSIIVELYSAEPDSYFTDFLGIALSRGCPVRLIVKTKAAVPRAAAWKMILPALVVESGL
ncbi:MAG: hypothetical protein M5U25_14890 [Planctomycetota bacterium]|nr:hypothetical protein [Planctomycetota bacterium]